jgi:AbrB family looped-hinge helix DNA binding protein
MAEIVKVDGKGRVLIPKTLRTKAEIEEGSYVKVEADEKRIVIESLEPVAEKYYGAFEVDPWPDDLDEFITEALRKEWTRKRT